MTGPQPVLPSPLLGHDDNFGKAMLAPQDFETLARWMKVAKGKALMSINDVPEIREIFAGFHMKEVQVTYTVAFKETARGRRGELLFRNFRTGFKDRLKSQPN